MSFTEMAKKSLLNFFIIVTGITIIMAVFGNMADPGQSFDYEAFYSPLLFGLIGVVPTFVFYSKKELTFRQMLVRKILHFIILELLILGTYILLGISFTTERLLILVVFIFIVYLFTALIKLMIDRKTMLEINSGLKRIQNQ